MCYAGPGGPGVEPGFGCVSVAQSVSFPSYSERCVGCLLCDKFPGARGLDGQQLSPHGVGRSGVRCQPSRGGCRAVGRGCGLLLGLDSGQERGVGGWTVGGLQAPLSRVGGFSPLSWEPLPSAASQQDRGFPRRARESNLRRDAHLHCTFCSLQMWGVLPRIGKGGSGRGHQERPPLQGDRPPWAAAVIKDCAPMSWPERRVRGRARWPLPGPDRPLATSQPNSSAVMPPTTSRDRAGVAGDQDECDEDPAAEI